MVKKALIFFFCFIPFGQYLFPKFMKLYPWYAQGHFIQVGILLFYSWYIFKKNKPLGSLLFWVGFITSWHWYLVLSTLQHFPGVLFYPFFNFLCMIILYDILVSNFNKESLQKLLTYLIIPTVLILVYCLLQKLSLDQFMIPKNNYTTQDEIVGVIGNPMHLTHHLCLLLPCLFMLKGEIRKWAIIALFSVLLLVKALPTGSSSGLSFSLQILCKRGVIHEFSESQRYYSNLYGGRSLRSGDTKHPRSDLS